MQVPQFIPHGAIRTGLISGEAEIFGEIMGRGFTIFDL
jgi:hypothetical protein